jgi:hypothetical protein
MQTCWLPCLPPARRTSTIHNALPFMVSQCCCGVLSVSTSTGIRTCVESPPYLVRIHYIVCGSCWFLLQCRFRDYCVHVGPSWQACATHWITCLYLQVTAWKTLAFCLTSLLDIRLQLLEPEKYPYLFKCLYGILMLLPQSSAFISLRNRLNAINSAGFLQIAPKSCVTFQLFMVK